MAQQQSGDRPNTMRREMEGDDSFKRNGPEPPENDSGPSPSVEESERSAATDEEPRSPGRPARPRKSH